MRLSSVFIQGNQTNIENAGKDTGAVSKGLENGMKEISGKMPGQTITGEVVSKNGNDLLISLGKNQLIRAKMDGNMQVDLGGQMSFAIKSMAGNKVVLSPLFANMANDPNVSKALQMAGIPENETSVNMVQTMMREGMPIDKNSLHQMMRTVNSFPKADMETMVQLTRLQIPVTEDTIFQMGAYKNYEHQMTEGLLTIADALTETAQGITAQGDTSQAVALYKEVFSMLTEKGMPPMSEQELLSLIQGKSNTLSSVPMNAGEAFLNAIKQAQGENLQTVQDAVVSAENTQEASPEQITENTAAGKEVAVLTGRERETPALQLKQGGFEILGEAFSQGKITEGQLFSQLNQILSGDKPISKEQMAFMTKLFEGEEFTKLLKNEMTKQWMLSPEEVGQENKVESLYEKLNQQMNRISHVLEQAAQAGSPLAKAAANVSGNIDFMNQLNQMFTYVQLPLKLQGQEANGDLYVYTNKRNLAQKDGEVSALLHLDMEYLGSVDVHVSMKDTNVATQFYLQDDSALDLIAENIDILNERLNKRGYSMNASFIHREDKSENIMEEILKQEKNISLISGYSFDVRA